jgi:hypothetical protein
MHDRESMAFVGRPVTPTMLVDLVLRLDLAERAVGAATGRDFKNLVAASAMGPSFAEHWLETPHFTDHDAWNAMRRPGSPPPRRRISVDLRLTRARGLRMTLHPNFFSEGDWKRAPEWRIAFDDIRDRNAVMAVPDVADLFEPVAEPMGSRELALRVVEAEALFFAWHATMKRLSMTFQVAVMGDLVMAAKPDPRAPLLSIVDTRSEYLDAIETWMASVERSYGYPLDRLWATFRDSLDARGQLRRELASRRLQTADGRRAALTPTATEEIERKLRHAKACGLFIPYRAEPIGAPPSPKSPPRPAPPAPKPAATRLGPLSYHGLAAAPLPPEVAAEFGVPSTIEMVERLNELYRTRREPPLPQGSFPSTVARLASFVRLYREEFAGFDDATEARR